MRHNDSYIRHSKDFKLKEDKKCNKVKDSVAEWWGYESLVS